MKYVHVARNAKLTAPWKLQFSQTVVHWKDICDQAVSPGPLMLLEASVVASLLDANMLAFVFSLLLVIRVVLSASLSDH